MPTLSVNWLVCVGARSEHKTRTHTHICSSCARRRRAHSHTNERILNIYANVCDLWTIKYGIHWRAARTQWTVAGTHCKLECTHKHTLKACGAQHTCESRKPRITFLLAIIEHREHRILIGDTVSNWRCNTKPSLKSMWIFPIRAATCGTVPLNEFRHSEYFMRTIPHAHSR